MQEVRIGIDCRVHDLVRILLSRRTPGRQLLRERLHLMMMILGTDDLLIAEINNGLSNYTINIFHALYSILNEWINQEANRNPSVRQFVAVLRECDLELMAGILERHNFLVQLPEEDPDEDDFLLQHLDPSYEASSNLQRCLFVCFIICVVLVVISLTGIGILIHKLRNGVTQFEPTVAPIIFTEAVNDLVPKSRTADNESDEDSRHTTVKPNESSTEGSSTTTGHPVPPSHIKLHVESYEEYQEKIPRVYDDTTVDLHICSRNATGWRECRNMFNTFKIISLHLEGEIIIFDIIGMLTLMPSLGKLSMVNTYKGICQYNRSLGPIPACPLYFPWLRKLDLENFVNCEQLMDAIAACFKMDELQTFNFSGLINDECQGQIHEIFRNSNRTIEMISISGTFDNHKHLFDFSVPFYMNKVRAILLNITSLDDTDHPIQIIHKHFCSVFGGLADFELSAGHIAFSQFVHLFSCRELRSVSVSTYVAKNDELEVQEMLKDLIVPAFLQRLHLTVNFSECSHYSRRGLINELKLIWADKVPMLEVCTICAKGENYTCYSN